MYDFIKLEVKGKSFKELRNLDFQYKVSPKSGVFGNIDRNGKEYAIRADVLHKNLKIELIQGKNEYITISGSLHKYFNEQNINYTDYTFGNFISTVQKIENELNIDKEDMRVLNLEYGVNIDTLLGVRKILQNVIVHKKKEFCTPIYDANGFSKKAKHYNYDVKLYDKGLQNKLDYDLMRYEISVNKPEMLKDLGIIKLSDLNLECSNMLANNLITQFKNILLYDYLNDDDSPYNKLSNHLYWSNMLEKGKEKDYKNALKSYNYKIKKRPNSPKNILLEIINQKLDYLLKN